MVTTSKEEALKAFTALGLCDQLAEAATDLGWTAPSRVQEQAIPLLLQGAPWFWNVQAVTALLCESLEAAMPLCRGSDNILYTGKDVIGLAQTGSGKTGAFALPILQAGLSPLLTTATACMQSTAYSSCEPSRDALMARFYPVVISCLHSGMHPLPLHSPPTPSILPSQTHKQPSSIFCSKSRSTKHTMTVTWLAKEALQGWPAPLPACLHTHRASWTTPAASMPWCYPPRASWPSRSRSRLRPWARASLSSAQRSWEALTWCPRYSPACVHWPRSCISLPVLVFMLSQR